MKEFECVIYCCFDFVDAMTAISVIRLDFGVVEHCDVLRKSDEIVLSDSWRVWLCARESTEFEFFSNIKDIRGVKRTNLFFLFFLTSSTSRKISSET